MESQSVLEIIRRRYRCDQCSKSHFKCDRSLPKCSKCIKRNIKCTLDRKLIYNKKDESGFGAVKKQKEVKFKNTSKANFIPVKEKAAIQNIIQLKETRHQLLKLPKDFNFPNNILGIFNRFKRKSLLENLLNLIQNPSPFFPSKGLNLFITLTDKLGLLTLKPRKLMFIPEVPDETTLNIGLLLKEAVVNYFKFINKTFPLFDETRFNFASCSFNLKSAIIVGGLLHMEQTETVKNVIKYFEGILYNFLSNVPRIKPNLDSIQTILITINGIACLPWIGGIKEFLLFHCYRISFIIGLNQSSKKLSKNINIERAYTYCVLNSFYNGMLLNFGACIAEPMLPSGLGKLDSYYTGKFSRHGCDFNKDDKDIQRYCFLKLQEFLYIISTLFFDLRLVKEKKINGIEDQVKFNNFLKKLSFKASAVKEKYITTLDYFLSFVDNQTLKATFKDYQNSITYFFHHINFWICSIQFKLSKEKKIYEFEEHTVNIIGDNYVSNYIKTILKQCYSVIDSAAIASHKYTLTLDCPHVPTCLVFMILYGGNDNRNVVYVKKGKELLESLLNIPSAMGMCRLNLKLVEMIAVSLRFPV
ncbi:hypothetical protein K502DRAFT_368532 [Neoconidiobolus thromboides FSU 785]|nr:hypothetical protein K502DRAFT_368532 [Neoconidiobolus thromboides FSU 785]